jgi:glycosyltransferase involved in cell wall biosynthesis
VTRVYWQGSFFATTSLALVNRRLVAALIERGNVDVSIGTDPFVPEKLSADLRAFTQHAGFGARDADITVSHEWPPHFAAPATSRYVHYQPWEYGSMPRDWFDALRDDCDDLWMPSTYNRNAYQEGGFPAGRLAVIPHGVDADVFSPDGPKPDDAQQQFRFLFVGGTIYRKGIDVLIEAYVRAFQGRRDVVLTIKDVNAANVYSGQNAGDQIRALKDNPDVPPIEYVDETLDDKGLAQLMRGADCLVHPYRGEAFALPVLEAMACGLPVIVTAGGATDDFVDETVGWKIPSGRRALSPTEVPFPTTTTPSLLEPEIPALVELLRNAFENPEEALRRGRAGAARARTSWSWERAAEIVEARLAVLVERTAIPSTRRHERYRDALQYSERIYSAGELDGIILELFKRLRIERPSFAEITNDLTPKTPARLLRDGLGWRETAPADAAPEFDLLAFGSSDSLSSWSSLAPLRPRAVTCAADARDDFIMASRADYTCVAIERLRGDALFVRTDLLAAAGFSSAMGTRAAQDLHMLGEPIADRRR